MLPKAFLYRNIKLSTKEIHKDLYYEGVSEYDIDQGMLGNCYFAGAVSSLAGSRPDIIEKMISKITDHSYKLYFYRAIQQGRKWGIGEKVFINVDDEFYVLTKDNKAMYGTSANGKEMWFAIFEKAYAKFKKGYNVIGGGGVPSTAMMEILGIKAKSLKINSPWWNIIAKKKKGFFGSMENAKRDLIFNYIKKSGQKNMIMVGATKGQGESRTKNKHIVSGHAYSIHGAFSDLGVKKLLVRNPWGNHRIRPNYPDYKSDGYFSITVKEFMKHFNYISFCKLDSL